MFLFLLTIALLIYLGICQKTDEARILYIIGMLSVGTVILSYQLYCLCVDEETISKYQVYGCYFVSLLISMYIVIGVSIYSDW
jgi:uncharacterized membrane protein YgdD (TMEM256/DUF423 family)